MSYRVVLADDHTLVRESCRALIEAAGGYAVVADVGDGRSAVEACLTHLPDLVIMDITMPGMNGIEASGQILAKAPGTRIIGLSMHIHPRFILTMLEAGVKGYVLKTSAATELITAMSEVLAGRTFISPAIACQLPPRGAAQPLGPLTAFRLLSPREREVLQLIADGLDTREIARTLGLSEKTIATHREHIMEKVGTQSIAKLTKYAIQEGLSAL